MRKFCKKSRRKKIDLINFPEIKLIGFSMNISDLAENNLFSPGNTLLLFKLETLSLGLTVCYDLGFPKLYQYLRRNCNLIINIANWPKNRINHWYILLKARAIENQLFIAGIKRAELMKIELNT